jgi:cystine transport system substrate-binding protein
VAAALAGASAVRAERAPDLRRHAEFLKVKEHATLLALYALDSKAEAARREVAAVRARLAVLRQQQTAARAQLAAARRTLARSERRLGQTLVALYESGGADPLAVVFGARSFSDAVQGLDGLTSVAASHARVAAQARSARGRITAILRTLEERAAETRRLSAAAEAKAAELERVRDERAAYLARVRAESAALGERIAAVEAEARAARAQARSVAVQAAAAPSTTAFAVPSLTAAPTPLPVEAAPVQAPPAGVRELVVTATAYSTRGTTSTGIPVGYGVVAVDPNVIPLGTRMTIPGYGEGVAADSGPGVQGAHIDVWLPPAEAAAWGAKTVTITLH